MLKDFDRGFSYGLVVALACSVVAYWLGRDRAPEPGISTWAHAYAESDDSANAVEITGESLQGEDAHAADGLGAAAKEAGCEYIGEIWVCTDGLGWLAEELNGGRDDGSAGVGAGSITTIEGTTDGITTSTSPRSLPADGEEVVFVHTIPIEFRGRFTKHPYPWFEGKAPDGSTFGIHGDYVQYWRPARPDKRIGSKVAVAMGTTCSDLNGDGTVVCPEERTP